MSRLLIPIVVAAAFLGGSVGRADAEWHAGHYQCAFAFGAVALVLLAGGAGLVWFAAARRDK